MNKILKYLIEAVVIIAILVACYYGVSKIKTSVTRSNEQDIKLTLEVQNQESDILEKIKVGDQIIDNSKTTYLGKILEISKLKPYKVVSEDYKNEKFIQAEVKGFYNREVLVKAKAQISDKSIMIGETELKVGYMIPIKSEKYILNSIITKIDIEKEE